MTEPRVLTILILERTPLISLDLFEQIADVAPEAAIHVVRTFDGALRALRALGNVDLAFLGIHAAEFGTRSDWQEPLQRVSRVVLTEGDRPAEGTEGWHVIARPFGPAVVASHVASMNAPDDRVNAAAASACGT